MFEHITDWKLLAGSHDFPGPDGGTCVNEAAIVAAGFEYKAVGSVRDCPPCFSRPIAQLAIGLNDTMPDLLRQKLLMPFVTKLAGTSDVPEVEDSRLDLILSAIMDVAGGLGIEYFDFQKRSVEDSLICGCSSTLGMILGIRAALAGLTKDLRMKDTPTQNQTWTRLVDILDRAIKMGNHQVIEQKVACDRMAKITKQPVSA